MGDADIRFDGQVALVTGAGKGIGRAHAVRLASRGAAVLVNNRNHPEDEGPGTAEQVAAGIRAQGGKALANEEHLERPGAAKRLIDDAVDRLGGLDVLICNAGTSVIRPFHKTTSDEIRGLVEVNVVGTLELLREALLVMREAGKGAILVTGSTSGLFGDLGFGAYGATKAALQSLVPTLATENHQRGIRINSLVPFAHTQMTDWIFDGGHFPKEAAPGLGPEIAADLACWLVSRDCALNGETLIAGGRTLARAETRASRGVELLEAETSPEAIRDHYAQISDMSEASTYRQGGDLLAQITDRMLSLAEEGAGEDAL